MRVRAPIKILVVGLACSVFLLVACAGTIGPRNIPSSLPPFGDVAVPDVVGMDIENALAEVGLSLVARIQYDAKASPAGVVVRTIPQAGEIVPLTSIVDVVLGGDRGEPHVETGVDAGLSPMGELAALYPEVFVGLDVLEDPPVFVFNPGIHEGEWKDELEWAARGRPYRTKACPVSKIELEQVQVGISLGDWWNDRDLGFGLGIRPGKCQVELLTDSLRASERRALRDAYGDLVLIDESGAPQPT